MSSSTQTFLLDSEISYFFQFALEHICDQIQLSSPTCFFSVGFTKLCLSANVTYCIQAPYLERLKDRKLSLKKLKYHLHGQLQM